MQLKDELRDFAFSLGISLFGVACVKPIKKEFLFSGETLRDLDYTISLGLRLSDGVLEDITSFPTKIYFHHYRQANAILDQIAFKVSNFIQSKGCRALPVPASQIVDWEKQTSHLSHKKIGELAGLGFIGRNNLLVNPEIGARFRLVTILTNMPLESDQKLKENCGECRACISVCPAGAIKEKREDFDHIKCFEKLKEFRDKRLVDQFVCGVCVKACKGNR
ncbi:MAG: 4Fe-4S double cluster binding domain-containing protein [Candidatus Omnitrophota bacterium]|nr:4Fe-4S double cluster binding domain-containing protein [Candidatus Omnitrophota bacterium]